MTDNKLETCNNPRHHTKGGQPCQRCQEEAEDRKFYETTEEYKAYKTLEANFTEKAGVYRRKDPNYQPTEEEYKAIDYLFNEWDYGYEE